MRIFGCCTQAFPTAQTAHLVFCQRTKPKLKKPKELFFPNPKTEPLKNICTFAFVNEECILHIDLSTLYVANEQCTCLWEFFNKSKYRKKLLQKQ